MTLLDALSLLLKFCHRCLVCDALSIFHHFLRLRPVDASHRSFSAAPYVSMDQAFKNYDGAYKPTEADWGEDAGQEVIA